MPTTGTLLCFALMYAVATGAKLYNLNPIDATSVLGYDAGLRGLRDARRRHDPTRPLRHRDLRLLAVSTSRQVQSVDAQVSMFYGCISAKATTCANTYGELAVPLKKKRE